METSFFPIPKSMGLIMGPVFPGGRVLGSEESSVFFPFFLGSVHEWIGNVLVFRGWTWSLSLE